MATYYVLDNGERREATADEIDAIEARAAEAEREAQAAAAHDATKASARAKLKGLGLTDEEIAALIP